MVSPRFFRDRAFSTANLVVLLAGFALLGFVFFNTLYFQAVQGWSPLEAGLRSLPNTLAVVVSAPLAGRLASRSGYRVPVTAGLLLAAAALLALTGIEVGTPYAQLWWKLAMLGAGLGLSISPATAAGVAAMPGTQAGVASAVITTSRQVGGALGVAVLGAVAAARYGHATPEADPAAFLAGVHAAYRLAAAALAVGAVASVLFLRPRRAEPDRGRPAAAGRGRLSLRRPGRPSRCRCRAASAATRPRLGPAGGRGHLDPGEAGLALGADVDGVPVALGQHQPLEVGRPADDEVAPALRAAPLLHPGRVGALVDHLVGGRCAHRGFLSRAHPGLRCTQDSHAPIRAGHTSRNGLLCAKEVTWKFSRHQADVVVEGAAQAGGDGDPVAHDAVGLAGAGLDEVVAAPDPAAAEVPLLLERVARRVEGDLAGHHVVVDGGEGQGVVGPAVAQDPAHLGLEDQVEVVGHLGVGVGGVVLDGAVDLRGEQPHDARVVGVHGPSGQQGERPRLARALPVDGSGSGSAEG